MKAKKRGLGLEVRTVEGQDGRSYLVFRTARGTYHVFAEVEAKGSCPTVRGHAGGDNEPDAGRCLGIAPGHVESHCLFHGLDLPFTSCSMS